MIARIKTSPTELMVNEILEMQLRAKDSNENNRPRALTLFSLHLQRLELPGDCAPGLGAQQTRTQKNTDMISCQGYTKRHLLAIAMGLER
jgi:hypothetical protein